jgi:5-formyltetrahydrofolate cyclo-ligase
MKEAAFDIQEPQYGDVVKPDMVLAPLLAFDQKGYRLGYGGGYYDATIQALRKQKEITYIGVGYAEQAVLFKLPREAHDIPLDYMLTPQGVIDFKEG